MKSLCDEIRRRREKDGFDFICEADFIRALLGFHRATRDFIELYTDLCYNQFDKKEFVGACNEPNRINSQERYFTNI